MSMFDLSGRTALITGATKGIGKAIAEQMAQAGARVVISSRKASRCEEVTELLRSRGAEAYALPCDVSDLAAVSRLADDAAKLAGPIDILVGNAAVNPHYGPLTDISEEHFDRIMSANLKSNLWLARSVLPGMAALGRGSIVMIASISALRGSDDIGAYGASKAALLSAVRHLAVGWGRHGITVNGIAPGLVKTDFARALWADPETEKRVASAYPLKRLGVPDDIAGAAVFLASRAGSFMTGQTLVIDGGGSISSSRAN